MSEDLFIKAMAKAYELHPGAKASSNFCWSLFKAGSETKDAEIERLRAERESDWEIMRKTVSSLTKACKDKDKLITELADALKIVTTSLREAVSNEDIAPCAIQNLYELDKRAREATKNE